MTHKIDLVCTEGPLAGERVQLKPDAPLLLGRSRRGLQLPDPLVSIEHAEISWTTDRYYIVDLGSLTGTFLDEERLGHESAPLRVGMTLQVGESTFQVQVRKERPIWFLPVLTLLTITAGILVVLAAKAAQPVVYEPVLFWNQPVNQGKFRAAAVVIPSGFVRKYGLDHRGLTIRRVTDYDDDGVDELWLDGPDRSFVVTFGTDGWLIMGELPLGCMDQPASTMPDQRCGGEWHAFSSGAYQRVRHEGPVGWVWVHPATAEAPQPIAPSPFRFTFGDQRTLAGFLAARGVTEPIHYLVCEEAVTGARAQVLTASGVVKPLEHGCIGELEARGSNPLEAFRGPPVAVAFTAAGRKALLEDLLRTWTGGSDLVFLDGQRQEVWRAWAADPQPRAGVRLGFMGAGSTVDSLAPETVAPLAPNAWFMKQDRPAWQVETVTLPAPGFFTIDPPGCSLIDVAAPSWHCATTRLCFPGSDFVTVSQRGCGAEHVLLTAPWGGTHVGGDANVEVRVAIDARETDGQVDVLRVRVAHRTVAAPAGDALSEGSEGSLPPSP